MRLTWKKERRRELFCTELVGGREDAFWGIRCCCWEGEFFEGVIWCF